MYSESVKFSSLVIKNMIKSSKKRWEHIIAVGTSTLHVLESSYNSPEWKK